MSNGQASKTAKVAAHFRAGETREALALAKGFRLGLSKEEQADICRAYEVLVRGGDFYRQLRKNPDTLLAKGIATLQAKIVAPYLQSTTT